VLALAPLIEVSPAKRKGLIEVRRHHELMFMWLGAVLRPTLHALLQRRAVMRATVSLFVHSLDALRSAGCGVDVAVLCFSKFGK
jgi:hypothetical protein